MYFTSCNALLMSKSWPNLAVFKCCCICSDKDRMVSWVLKGHVPFSLPHRPFCIPSQCFEENLGVYLKCTIILNGSVKIIVQIILLCMAEIAIQPNWILPAKMVFFMLPDLVLLISKTNVILMLHKLCWNHGNCSNGYCAVLFALFVLKVPTINIHLLGYEFLEVNKMLF